MSTAMDYNSLLYSFRLDAEMSKTIEYLNLVRAKTGAVSDYALSKKLETSKQSMSLYAQKGKPMGDEVAVKVAEILEIDPAIVVAAVRVDSAQTEKEKAMWQSIFERLGGIAAAITLGIGFWGTPPPANAASQSDSHKSVYYVKSERRKRPRNNPLNMMVTQLLQAA